MSKPTTGERIVMDGLEYDLKTLRTTVRCGALLAIAHAIDAAIAEAVKVKMEAILEVCNEQASQAINDSSHHALSCAQAIRNAVVKHHTDAMAAIRARGNQ
jgi:hypothetical protein